MELFCYKHAATELERLRAEAALTPEQVGAGAWALAGY